MILYKFETTKTATMKNFLILLFALISFSASSQVSIGLTGGFLIPASGFDKDFKPNSGYKTGLEVLIGVSEKVTIRTGLELNSFTFKQETRFTNKDGGVAGIVNIYNNSKYLGIPIALRIGGNKKTVNPFFDFGVTSLIKLSDNTRYSKSGILNNGVFMEGESFMLSPMAGLGLLIKPSDHLYLSILANYNYQIQPMYKFYKGDLRYNSIALNVSIGYKF